MKVPPGISSWRALELGDRPCPACQGRLVLAEHPERAIEFAVKGMLPKNPLGRAMFKKLHVVTGDKHAHAAQQPKPLDI